MRHEIIEVFNRHWIPVTESGCWIWIASVNTGGYGQLRIEKNNARAHRVSWEIHRGDIPKDAFVLHRCDTPSCVNPSHLYLGSQAINMRDMADRKRSYDRKGEKNHKAKLKELQVIEIIQKCKNGGIKAQIAREYGVTPELIGHIQRGKCWSYLRQQTHSGALV